MSNLTQTDTVASEDELDALDALQTRIADSLAGFDTMVAKAEPEFRPTARAFRDLHSRHKAEVERLLAEAGRAAGGEGSFMGTVNRAVVTARAFFDEIDADVMGQIRSGESHVLKAFDEAIGHTAESGRVARLRALRAELAALLAAPPIA